MDLRIDYENKEGDLRPEEVVRRCGFGKDTDLSRGNFQNRKKNSYIS